jgi:hypothetical protein
MKTFLVIAMLAFAFPAYADEPRQEITVTTTPAPPPRECVEVKDGEALPVPRSDGERVEMDACKVVPVEGEQ